MFKKLSTALALCAIATPAHALSMLSLHAMPVSPESSHTSMLIVALAGAGLAATLAYRISRN